MHSLAMSSPTVPTPALFATFSAHKEETRKPSIAGRLEAQACRRCARGNLRLPCPLVSPNPAHSTSSKPSFDAPRIFMHSARLFMQGPRSVLTDTQQTDRREAILRILRSGSVRNQRDLVRLLNKQGHEV